MKQRFCLLPLLLAAHFALAAANPGREMAEQYRTLERMDVKPARKAKLQLWLGEKRPAKAAPTRPSPNAAGVVADDGMLLAVDPKSGLPTWLSFGDGENLLANDACRCPLWEILVEEPGADKPRFIGPYSCTVSLRRLSAPSGLEVTYTCPEAIVKVAFRKAEGTFVRLAITAENRIAANRLEYVDFPKLALRPRGDAAANLCAIPWRRGRLRRLAQFTEGYHEEYPCSSARFQMTALYDEAARKGIYFAAEDGDGWEKHFLQTYIPAYNVLVSNLRFFPPDRGRAGNRLPQAFTCLLGAFDGDWYDAAQIYRAWFLKQKWASRGPLATNDTPDFLKHSPVWLRYYLRESRKLGPEQIGAFQRWSALFPGRKIPATLYHFSNFKEPADKPKYPVCEYYGFRATAYPGLPEALKAATAGGLRCSVYWQSEIINQDAPENAPLVPADKLDRQGRPVLYLGERGVLCRQAPVWLRRTAEVHEYQAGLGFTGFYLDTYGKSKPDTQCFDTRHGHFAGGANQECLAQRVYGEAVRRHIRAMAPEYYMGGEASCECYVDLLDYKLNAVATYPGHIPLERALYGDYILSHGRVVREYTPDELRLIGFDFLEGCIPGRFFSPPPEGAPERKFLQDICNLTEAAYDYLRAGRMLRPVPFGKPVAMMKLTNPQKMETEEWRNTSYRSCKDASVGIAVFRFGVGEAENTLLLPDAKALGVPEGAAVYRLAPDGAQTRLGTLAQLRELPVKLPGNGFCLFVIR